MSEATTEPAPGAGNSPGAGFVLESELAEVYLLLDNISTNTHRTLSEMDVEATAALGPDWLKTLSRIKWPPKPDDPARDTATDAALVIRAKDFLNRQTHPATGHTIAFTLLVTQEEMRDDTESASAWGRAWHWLKWGRQKKPAHRAASRTSLACQAYPGLARKAVTFRWWMFWMSILLFIWLLLTVVLSMYTAFGNATLTQLGTVTASVESARKRVSDAEAAKTATEAVAPTAGPAGAGAQRTAATTAVPLCMRHLLLTPLNGNGVSVTSYTNVSEMQACQDLLRAESEQRHVRHSLSQWLNSSRPLRLLVGVGGNDLQDSPCFWTSACAETPAKARPAGQGSSAPSQAAKPDSVQAKAAIAADSLAIQDDIESRRASYASALAAILASAVLPVFYGILGAGAAIVRSLSHKMENSLLSPRDLSLSLQRLALGAVVGTCISLFVGSPAGDGEGAPSLLTTVALSGSALSFLGGYSVEAVFATLELLIRRIFNMPDPPSTQTPRPSAPPPGG